MLHLPHSTWLLYQRQCFVQLDLWGKELLLIALAQHTHCIYCVIALEVM